MVEFSIRRDRSLARFVLWFWLVACAVADDVDNFLCGVAAGSVVWMAELFVKFFDEHVSAQGDIAVVHQLPNDNN